MNVRRGVLVPLIIFAVIAAAAIYVFASQKPHVAASPKPVPSATPTRDAITIAAIRAHPVAASTITITAHLAPRAGCPTYTIAYISDGLKVNALMTLPASAQPPAGYPVLILAHGYIPPSVYKTTGTDYQPFIDYFCAAGYAVVKPDYRGNGGSQGNPVSGQFDPGYTYDILNLAASLPSVKSLDPHRIALIGHSLGGAVVLRAAVASHNLPIKGYIFIAGVVASLQDIAYNWPNAPADIGPYRQAFIKAHGSPAQNPSLWHDASAINYVSAIKAPVQINVDSADAVVPPAFSASLNQALAAAGHNPGYFTYPGNDHQFANSANRVQLVQNMASFLAAHI